MRVRTFVSDLLEQLLNRRVSRLIFHDDQNLRLGIARRVSAGSRGRGGAREVTGKSLSTAMREEVETVVPRSGGRAVTGGATRRDAIRVFGRTLRPSGNFGRVARMRSWVDALGCITPACMFRGEGPLRIPPKCSLRFRGKWKMRERTSGASVAPSSGPCSVGRNRDRSDPPRERVVVGNAANRPLRRSRVRPGC